PDVAYCNGVASRLSNGEIAGMGLGDGKRGRKDVGGIVGAVELGIASAGYVGNIDNRIAAAVSADIYDQRNGGIAAAGSQRIGPGAAYEEVAGAVPAGTADGGHTQAEGQKISDRNSS